MSDLELTNSVLPAQVSVRSIYNDKREPMLRGPARLHGIVDGKAVEWIGSVTLGETRADLVQVSSTSIAGDVAIDAKGTFEFDGMEKVTLKVEPRNSKTPAVSQLTLSIPFAEGFADLYRPNRALMHPNKVEGFDGGAIPPDGVAHDWRPSVWIGNTRRGLDWFTENWRGWRTGKSFVTKTIEVENSPDGVTLHIHFIRMDPDQPLVLDKPREIVFGLMATPARMINRKAIRIGVGHYHPEHSDKLEDDVAAGINASEVWNHHDFAHMHRHLQGWPDQTPEQTAKLAAMGKPLSDRGIAVIPYSGWYLSRNALVYPTWGAEMGVEPMIEAGFQCDICCWNTPVTDAYLWQMRKASRETGYSGFRMDAGFGPIACSSLRHHREDSVCGWRDDNGNLQPSLAIFGAREAAKRAYRMFHGPEITENGLCASAIYGNTRFAAILTFMDAGLTSEGAEMSAHSIQEFDMSFFRAVVMEGRYGLQLIYGPKGDRLGYDTRLAIGTLHALTPRGVNFVATQDPSYSRAARPSMRVAQAQDWVKWLDEGTDFRGYWENGALLKTGREQLYGSLHIRPGERVLLALFNREALPIEQEIRLNTKAMGFTGDTFAIDAVTDEPIAITDGAMTLTLTPEGFRLIKIASQPFGVVEPRKVGENLIPELTPANWPAQGVPAGWNPGDSPAAFSMKESEIVITGHAGTLVNLGRSLPLASDKTYILEMEVRVDADNGVHLGPLVDQHMFKVAMGGSYYPCRSIASELLPERYETLKVRYHKPKEVTDGTSLRFWLNGDGKVFIRRIALYEVESSP